MDRTCTLCGKVFDYPSRLKQHAARKTRCTSDPPPKLYTCHCGKSYEHKQSLSKHKKSCPDLSEFAPSLKEQVGSKELAAVEAKVVELEKLIKLQAPAPNNMIVAGPITINHHETKISSNDTYNVINIHVHGEEDTSHLKELLGKLLDRLEPGTPGDQIIAKVLGLIYRDPAHPQNMTVCIPSARNSTPWIRTLKGWEPQSEHIVYPAMITRACNELMQKQDFELGYTPEGLAQLEVRSEHVKAAFDAEPHAKHPKVAAQILRPVLRQNQHVVASLLEIGFEEKFEAEKK